MSLQIGNRVPDFTLKNHEGEDFNISSLIGIQPFVIFFYPRDFTPGCTKEACAFRDSYQDFQDHGAEVIGISSDSEEKHRKFIKSYNLPYILLSDKDKKVRRIFGVKNNLFGLLPGRETYVFNKDGKAIMIFNSTQSTIHIEKALAALKTIK